MTHTMISSFGDAATSLEAWHETSAIDVRARQWAKAAASVGVAQSAVPSGNYRSYRYGVVIQAVQMMAKMPVGHPLHMEPDAVSRAVDVLGACLHLGVDEPPQVFPADEETLVIKWVFGKFQRLVSLSPSEADIVEMDLSTNRKCVYDLPGNGDADLTALFARVAKSALSCAMTNG